MTSRLVDIVHDEHNGHIKHNCYDLLSSRQHIFTCFAEVLAFV